MIINPVGLLYDEPMRLLLDDLRDINQPITLLSVIAGGVHKPVELGSRLKKPASDLTRPLNRLIQLGYLLRERPYGTRPQDNMKSLYKVDDPFMRFYYRFVYPNLTMIERGRTDELWKLIEGSLPGFVSLTWERLCVLAIAYDAVAKDFYDCDRWWGKNVQGKFMEIDLVAQTPDKSRLLVGECKWSTVKDEAGLRKKLFAKARLLPFYQGQEIITVIAAKDFSGPTTGLTLEPARVLEVLRQ